MIVILFSLQKTRSGADAEADGYWSDFSPKHYAHIIYIFPTEMML